MNLDLLLHLISLSEKSHARVRAVTCDMGNQKLLGKIGVYKDKNYCFKNPFDEARSVYLFCDIPHCFKNLRNNILDHTLVIKQSDSKSYTLDRALFQKLVDSDKTTEFKICPKISDIHINVHAHVKQGVQYAA